MKHLSDVRVGVIAGTRLPGNVRTLLVNIQELLKDHPVHFKLDLIIREGVEVPDGYNPVDPGFGVPDRAIDTLRTMSTKLTDYSLNHPVDVFFQVTKFPLHGCAAVLAGRRTDTPVLTRFAGDNFREYRLSKGFSQLKTFGLNNVIGRVPVHLSDRIIVLGPYGRSEIEERNDDVPIEEIPQPVDRNRFSPVSAKREEELAEKSGFPTHEQTLLTVGRLTERKGMKTLIEVAEVLNERNEPFRWYVAGDGPMREELDAVTGVEVLGRINFERMADYYRAADLLVHPSLVEGLPNVLLEAAACGTPTIARDVGDCSLVSSATFEETEELLDLLKQTHAPSALGEHFESDRLRNDYARVLIETAREKP